MDTGPLLHLAHEDSNRGRCPEPPATLFFDMSSCNGRLHGTVVPGWGNHPLETLATY